MPGISMVVKTFRPVTVTKRRTKWNKVLNQKKQKNQKMVQENKIMSLT